MQVCQYAVSPAKAAFWRSSAKLGSADCEVQALPGSRNGKGKGEKKKKADKDRAAWIVSW